MTLATGSYRIRFAADPMELVFFRAGLVAWLEQLRWPEPDRIDAVLAVSEACANVVKHAYAAGVPGDVEVVGRLVVGPDDRRIVVIVRDEGRWRGGPGSEPGYGLRTLHECMAQVRIRHDARGTVVTMTSRPVPMPGPDAEDRPRDEAGIRGSVGGQRRL